VPFWRASRSSAQSEATAAMLASGVSQRPVAQQLGGSAPAVSTPHRGARFAFDAMVGIGRRKPGSIRPPGNQETTDPQPASCFWGSLRGVAVAGNLSRYYQQGLEVLSVTRPFDRHRLLGSPPEPTLLTTRPCAPTPQ
jgi:hypothetical protein